MERQLANVAREADGLSAMICAATAEQVLSATALLAWLGEQVEEIGRTTITDGWLRSSSN